MGDIRPWGRTIWCEELCEVKEDPGWCQTTGERELMQVKPDPGGGNTIRNSDGGLLTISNIGEAQLLNCLLFRIKKLSLFQNILWFEGRFSVNFVPRESGVHYVHITLNGNHVPGSPYPVQVGGVEADAGRVQGLRSWAIHRTVRYPFLCWPFILVWMFA